LKRDLPLEIYSCSLPLLLQKRLDEEMNQLLIDIKRIGVDGAPNVTFGELFDDDNVQQYYEALVGTLKCAKKRGLIEYKGILLLKGVSDDVVISIRNSS
jgi:Costars